MGIRRNENKELYTDDDQRFMREHIKKSADRLRNRSRDSGAHNTLSIRDMPVSYDEQYTNYRAGREVSYGGKY